MDGINQTQSHSAPENKPPQQNQKAAEDQASEFSKRMEKKKDGKKDELEDKKGEQTLENLFAERNKKAQGRTKDHDGEKGDGQKEQLESFSNESGSTTKDQAVGQIREIQSQSEIQLKSIQQVNGPKEINETISKLVDKIHVSAKDSINGSEVRISMKEAVLPGTEIRIQRVGGEVTVTMNTTSAESHNFLAQHEASLQKSLSDRFGNDKVQVNINMSGGGGEQNDGRSQEEYVGEEEQDDNDNEDS